MSDSRPVDKQPIDKLVLVWKHFSDEAAPIRRRLATPGSTVLHSDQENLNGLDRIVREKDKLAAKKMIDSWCIGS